MRRLVLECFFYDHIEGEKDPIGAGFFLEDHQGGQQGKRDLRKKGR